MMGAKVFVFIFVIWGCMYISESARILGVFPIMAPSHFILGFRILKELADKGHDVTMISCFPQKTKLKNYRDISVADTVTSFKPDMNLFAFNDMWVPQQAFFTHMIGATISNLSFTNPKVQELLQSDEKFDLVIAEYFMNDFQIGFAHRFNCPYIILSTMGSNHWINSLVSNPAPYAYVPDLFLKYTTKMTFWERIYNTYFGLFYQLFREFYFLPFQDNLLHLYFKDAPPLKELMRNNLSLILLNSHPVTTDAVPHVPAMIEIGGFHVAEPKALPKDLKDFMDSAKDGVILFSMGSNLKSSQLPPEKRDAILKSFSKLKQKIIWKWEEDVLPGQPSNVKLSKWLPQNDIMAHPNLKAFLTHGGLLSTTEAIHHGVPIIGIPIFGDQKMNMAHAVQKKYGILLDYNDITEESLTHALNEILNNPTYRDNIKKRSTILHDQPIKPLDAAIFWIEYVLRHKGAKHFRSAAQDLHWYQLYLVDVAAFTIMVTAVFLILFFYMIRKCFSRKKEVRKNIKKKNL